MKRIRAVALLLALCLLLSACGGTQTPLERTAKYLKSAVPEPGFGSLDGDWIVFGLARAGADLSDGYFDRYYTAVEAAVQAAKAAKGQAHTGGCRGSRMRTMQEKPEAPAAAGNVPSQLRQWPVQIKLVSPAAPYFDGADLLIAADCTAYAYGNFHSEFMRGKVTLIGCPKLDAVQYAEKLTEIFARNDIRSVTLTRMEVPCCGGMEFAIRTALGQAGKEIPFRTVVLSIDGAILEER